MNRPTDPRPHSFSRTPTDESAWIYELSRQEANPEWRASDAAGAADGSEANPELQLEEETLRFLENLKSCFEENARVFNLLSEGGRLYPEVKIYQIAQSASDFMVFRGQLKLLVRAIARGIVQISYALQVRNSLSVNGVQPLATHAEVPAEPRVFSAHIGLFGEVTWSFEGERTHPVSISKFYFAEFIRHSRATLRHQSPQMASSVSPQAKVQSGNSSDPSELLQQIKSLIEEKGLHLK